MKMESTCRRLVDGNGTPVLIKVKLESATIMSHRHLAMHYFIMHSILIQSPINQRRNIIAQHASSG